MVRRNIPLVDQVILEILSEIDSGGFARHDGMLPSEADLSQRFGVSRATVREALSKLELTGIVIRRHGVGTFVNQFLSRQPALVQEWFEEAHGFTDAIRGSGRDATCRFLRVAIEAAGDLGQFLLIAPSAPVVVTVKVITSGAVPLIYNYNALPLQLLDEEARGKAESVAIGTDSIYELLERCCHQRVHHQQSEVRAALADENIASALDCQLGDPCLRVEEVAYNAELTPLFYGLNHFRGDVVSFRQVRRPSLTLASMPG